MTTTVIGVLGGVGSGKSTVAALFAERGARVIDADALAHEVLEEPAVIAAVTDRFGADVLDGATGRVSRESLGRMVFGAEKDALGDLEAIIHPRVRARIAELLERGRRDGVEWIVLDVPLLLDTPWRDACDLLLFVRSNETLRRARVAERGWDSGELELREARQTPVAEKERIADIVIENEGGLDELAVRIDEILATTGTSGTGESHG